MAYPSSIQKGQIPINCQLCEEDSKIQYKCKDCDLLMCRKCKEKTHSKFKNASNHRIIDTKEIGVTDENYDLRFSDVQCQAHESQPCCVYCKTCKQLICLKCVTKAHNGHTFIDEEEFGVKRKTFGEKRERFEENYDILLESEDKIKELKELERYKYNKGKKDILSQKTAVEKRVNQEAERLMKELDRKWKSFNYAIGIEEKKVDEIKKRMNTKSDALKDTKASKNFVEFIELIETFSIASEEEMLQVNLPSSVLPLFVATDVNQYSVGKFEKPKLKVLRSFTTDLKHVYAIVTCADKSFWIGDDIDQRIHHVSLADSSMTSIHKYDNMKIFKFAVMSYPNVLLSFDDGNGSLRQINENTGQIKNTKYNVSPLITRGIHVTADNRVIICARSKGPAFPRSGRRVVILLDQEGKLIQEYEYDINNKPLFTVPLLVTTTNNGNICVVDVLDDANRREVVILSQGGDVISVYTGHQDINKDKLFSPQDIVTTHSDNIIMTDVNTHSLHILNSSGQFITYYRTDDMGIIFPSSLAVVGSDKLYIGCDSEKGSPDTFRAKLYEMEYSGF